MQKGYITQTEYEYQKKLAINDQYELLLTEFELQSMSYNELIEYKELRDTIAYIYHAYQNLKGIFKSDTGIMKQLAEMQEYYERLLSELYQKRFKYSNTGVN